jgi:hypothetical protein
LHDLIAHLGLDGAKLVFHINAVLAAQSQQVFALHAQLARQSENTNFLFLQAELLCSLFWHTHSPCGYSAVRRPKPT